MNYESEFKKFALSEGITSSNVDRYQNLIENNRTPYILEEREMRVTQMDVFSRLLKDRIIFLSGVVNNNMSDIIQAQLLFLDSLENKDITLYINSPGGSVLHGLGIVDVMDYIKSDIATTNIGMAASMGSVLLSCGTKGKRSSLNYSKVMIHQVSNGLGQSNIQDLRISQMESEKYNFILFKILAENSGKDFYEVLEAARRDKWLNSKEALDFGFIDEIIVPEGKKTIDELMIGFEDYYNKEVLNK